jgi:hypothetical protein
VQESENIETPSANSFSRFHAKQKFRFAQLLREKDFARKIFGVKISTEAQINRYFTANAHAPLLGCFF